MGLSQESTLPGTPAPLRPPLPSEGAPLRKVLAACTPPPRGYIQCVLMLRICINALSFLDKLYCIFWIIFGQICLKRLTTYARRAILIVDLAHGLKHAAQVLLVVFCKPYAAGKVPARVEAVSIVGGADNPYQHSGNLSGHETEVWWQC